MTPSAIPARPPPTPDPPPIDVAAIEAALAHGGARPGFGGALESAFERDTARPRVLRHLVCNLLGTTSFFLESASDVTRLAGLGPEPASLRNAVTGVCLLVVAVLWLGRRSMPRWAVETLTAVGTLLIAFYAIYIGHRVDNVVDVMHVSGVMLVFPYTAVIVRLGFGHALFVNACTFFGYALFANGAGEAAAEVVRNHLLLFGTVLVFATAGNHLLDLRQRRGYLLDRLKTLRHEALRADAERLRELALRDGLTGLHNRRHFDEALAGAWAAAARRGGPVALLQVDVDHFKRYNDHYGHPAGDACLIQLAHALEAVAAHHGGLAARVGGEEFALLLPEGDTDRAGRVAAELCDRVRALALPHAASTTARHVTASVGVAALVPGPGRWASALVGAADAALYAAKHRGRDGFALFEPPLVPASSPRQRNGGESLSPETKTSTDDLAEIERCTDLLGRDLRRLRFPADFEADFQERDDLGRRRRLAVLTTCGIGLMLVYLALCRPVYRDIADTMRGAHALQTGVARRVAVAVVVVLEVVDVEDQEAERLARAREHAHSPAGRFVTVSVGAASRVLESAADGRLL